MSHSIFYPYLPIIFLLGLCWGSFLKLCIDRIPKNKSIILPSSECFSCNKPLRFYHNIPIISWIILKRRCSYCNVIIPYSYPLTELIVACLISLLFNTFSYLPIIIIYTIFFSLLVIGSGIDLKEFWIPDTVSIGGIFLGLVFSYFFPILHSTTDNLDGLLSSIIGFISGSAILILIAYLAKIILHKNGMGMGDVKLLGAIGAFTGWKGVIFSIFFGSLVALLISFIFIFLRKKSLRDQVPFGPYLSFACIIYILSKSQILNIFTDSLFLY